MATHHYTIFAWPLFQLALLLSLSAPLVAAGCECGFTIDNQDNDLDVWKFTEMLETNFSALQNLTTQSDWIRQEYNVSAEDGRGEYGKAFMPSNVGARVASREEASDSADLSALELKVGTSLSSDAVPAAEIDSSRLDLHWGSYRTGMKVTSTNGTCAAFFWYFNDTQEIDMEFLSREFKPDENIYPISLVIQSRESKEAGYDASETGTYQRVNLTFDPTADFHEYRFDYLPGKVLFYADSKALAVMEGAEVPSVGGHLILQHWSNGNPLWSGGPPTNDAVLEVNYVKAYFNSSDATRVSHQVQKCHARAVNDREVCVIPDVTAADVRTGGHFFSRPDSTETDARADDEEETTATSGSESGLATWSGESPIGAMAWRMIVMASGVVWLFGI